MTLSYSRRTHAAQKNSQGFTIAELLVTITLLGAFVYAAVQGYLFLEYRRLLTVQKSVASDIAITNLNKFSARPPVASCSTEIDLATSTYNFTAETTMANKSLSILGPAVTQTVKGYPVDGCNGSSFVSQTMKIVSTVTYKGGAASSATYVQ